MYYRRGNIKDLRHRIQLREIIIMCPSATTGKTKIYGHFLFNLEIFEHQIQTRTAEVILDIRKNFHLGTSFSIIDSLVGFPYTHTKRSVG